MTPSIISVPALVVLTLIAATTVLVGQLCFWLHDTSMTKKLLRRRLGPFAHDVPIAGAGNRLTATPMPGGGGHGLTGSTLSAPEREFALRLAKFHVQPAAIPWFLRTTRLALAAGISAGAALAASSYPGLSGLPTLAAIVCIGASVGYLLPAYVVDRLALSRRRAVAHGLPDAIELLVIAVEAGLSLEEAINRVVVELQRSQPAIARELALTSADLQILPNRDEALQRLADRVDLPTLRSVVTTLSQTMRYGTPLAQGLRVVAAELRNNALLKLEEQANRIPVLLTVPMILFILPSLFLIIGGPAALRLLDIFAK